MSFQIENSPLSTPYSSRRKYQLLEIIPTLPEEVQEILKNTTPEGLYRYISNMHPLPFHRFLSLINALPHDFQDFSLFEFLITHGTTNFLAKVNNLLAEERERIGKELTELQNMIETGKGLPSNSEKEYLKAFDRVSNRFRKVNSLYNKITDDKWLLVKNSVKIKKTRIGVSKRKL